MKTILCFIKTLFQRGIFIAAVCLCMPELIHGSSMADRLKTQFYAYIAAKAKRGGLDIIRQQLDPETTDFHILQRQQDEDLRAFFDALNTLGQPAGWSSYFSSKDYFAAFDNNAQKRHIAACQRAVFEVDWDIERSIKLTDSELTAFIGKRRFANFIKNTKWPHAYTGLETLAQQFQEKHPGASNPYYFPRSIPYLASNIYEEETLTTAFNNNTSKQLLDWVQKKINAIFELSITDVGMKYVLINLVSTSATDQKALETLYKLAFFYDYSARQEQNISAESEELTHILQQPDKNLGVIELKKLVSNLDWLSGRMTIFWQSRWQNEGIIKTALKLPNSVKLYDQLQKQFSDQSSLIAQSAAPQPLPAPVLSAEEAPAQTQNHPSTWQTIKKDWRESGQIIDAKNALIDLAKKTQKYIEESFEPAVIRIFNNFPKIPRNPDAWINNQRIYLDNLYKSIEKENTILRQGTLELHPSSQKILEQAQKYLQEIPDYMENRIHSVQRAIKQLKQQPTSQQSIPFIPTQDMPALPQAPTIARQEEYAQQPDVINQIIELLKTLETLALQTNLHLEKEFMPTIENILQQVPEKTRDFQSWLTSQERYSTHLLNEIDEKLKTVKQLIQQSGVTLDTTVLQRFKDVEKDLIENIEYMDDKIASIAKRYSGTTEEEED